MNPHRPRRCPARRWLWILIAPPVLWALILTAIPTRWARDRVVAHLAAATGRSVHLGALRLGPLGGVRLTDLEIGEPAPRPSACPSPWLRAERLSLDINLLHLLRGRIEPTRIEVRGLALRLHRRADGSLEFGDLLGPSPTPPTASLHPSAPPPPAANRAVVVAVEDGQIRVIDEPEEIRLDFEDIHGQGVWRGRVVEVEGLEGTLNGGTVCLDAQLVRSGRGPELEGVFRAEGVALGVGMGPLLGYLVPVLAGTPADLDGRLDLDLALHASGATRRELVNSLAGQGSLVLDPIGLDGSRLLAELGAALPAAARDRVGSIRSRFVVGGRRVTSDELTVEVAGVPIALSGWADFDGQLDYRVGCEALTRSLPALADRLPPEARAWLGELPDELDDWVGLRISGNWDDLTVRVDPPEGPASDLVRRAADRDRVRELGRQLRDRVLR